MSSNGGIVVIKEALDIQVLSDSETSGFGVITLCRRKEA